MRPRSEKDREDWVQAINSCIEETKEATGSSESVNAGMKKATPTGSPAVNRKKEGTTPRRRVSLTPSKVSPRRGSYEPK